MKKFFSNLRLGDEELKLKKIALAVCCSYLFFPLFYFGSGILGANLFGGAMGEEGLFLFEMRRLGQPENFKLTEYSKVWGGKFGKSSYEFLFTYSISDESVLSYYRGELEKKGWAKISAADNKLVYQKTSVLEIAQTEIFFEDKTLYKTGKRTYVYQIAIEKFKAERLQDSKRIGWKDKGWQVKLTLV